MKTKEEIREEIRRKLKALGVLEARKQSQKIRRALYRLETFKRAKCVLVYLSLKGEVDTFPVVQKCFRMGKRVLVPKVGSEGRLELREIWSLKGALEKGPWGIWEPRARKTRPVSLRAVDCMILPGVAFDKAGNRLGRGKGFFDRLLSRAGKKPARVGLAFSCQNVDALPIGNTDQPVDIVLSS